MNMHGMKARDCVVVLALMALASLSWTSCDRPHADLTLSRSTGADPGPGASAAQVFRVVDVTLRSTGPLYECHLYLNGDNVLIHSFSMDSAGSHRVRCSDFHGSPLVTEADWIIARYKDRPGGMTHNRRFYLSEPGHNFILCISHGRLYAANCHKDSLALYVGCGYSFALPAHGCSSLPIRAGSFPDIDVGVEFRSLPEWSGVSYDRDVDMRRKLKSDAVTW